MKLEKHDKKPMTNNNLYTISKKIQIKDRKLSTRNSNLEFLFDNETLNFDTNTKPYEIDTCPVSVEEFLHFYENDGYSNKPLWSKEGWNWLLRNKNNTFINLCSSSKNRKFILNNWFGLDHLVEANFPALHITFYEAEAYCNWKKRRLPTELEWLLATEKEEFEWGNVWEWTNDIFMPYERFRPHPYEDYSKPWFNDHQIVKGSSFATQKKFCHHCYDS